MTTPDALRNSIVRTRTKLYRWIAITMVVAAIGGAVGEGFPNTVQSYVAYVALFISFGIITRYAFRLDKLLKERRKQQQVIN